MSEGRKSKSIWKRYEKPKTKVKGDENEKRYYQFHTKTGRVETNLLQFWEWS